MTYKHTAADAIALAATCEKRVQSGAGVALNAAATDMVAKALKFWAEHQPHMFKKGDKIVCPQAKPFIFTVHAVHSKNIITVSSHAGLTKLSLIDNVFRLATPEEEAAGHRIDEVQDGQ